MVINYQLSLASLESKIQRFWDLSGQKILQINKEYDGDLGSPVFTVKGKYTTRGWTEWTEGFRYGASILQFDATNDNQFLEDGRQATLHKMASHVGHFGVHDHGFNNVSTYGNLLRLMHEGRIPTQEWEKHFYELALKLSGAIQAKRWTNIPDGGYIYSFNGPHSLFVDTIRSVRALTVSHALGHAIWDEHDERISLLERAVLHSLATAKYNIFYNEGRDSFDEWGRTAHEAIFNTNDGHFRCPNAQQGFSGFTTWTRGLAWAMAGFPEQLEFIDTLDPSLFDAFGGYGPVQAKFLKAAKATCDFFINNTPTDGVPYWDTGAPNLHKMGDYLNRPSDPYNPYEPVDASAAAIGAQGLLRLGKYLEAKEPEASVKYFQAGLTTLNSLLETPYLSEEPNHQGLLLHCIYHQPNGWDYVPEGSEVAYGESCMWGDYHIREVVLYAQRMLNNAPYYTFFGCLG